MAVNTTSQILQGVLAPLSPEVLSLKQKMDALKDFRGKHSFEVVSRGVTSWISMEVGEHTQVSSVQSDGQSSIKIPGLRAVLQGYGTYVDRSVELAAAAMTKNSGAGLFSHAPQPVSDEAAARSILSSPPPRLR